jgi:hypothetical protein
MMSASEAFDNDIREDKYVHATNLEDTAWDI